MRIFRSRLICLAVLAAAALAVPQGAAAADAAAAQAGGPRVIQEVIVTARKREESVQDVPIAITALSEELNNSNIRGLADLCRHRRPRDGRSWADR